MHLVARGTWTARLAPGRSSWCLVIPRGQEGASFADREVGLPLRLGWLGVGIQLEWGTKCYAAIAGTDVKYIAGGAGARVGGGIDIANYVVEGSRLTPAHVSPVGRVSYMQAKQPDLVRCGPWKGAPV